MFSGCSRLVALHARRLNRLHRFTANASRSIDFETMPPDIGDEAAPLVNLNAGTDRLAEAIFLSASSGDLLEVIKRHGAVMNSQHIMECWGRLAAHVDHVGNLERLKEDQGFLNLVERTCEKKHLFNGLHFLLLAYYLRKFEFTAESELVENYCRALRSRFREIPLHELIVIQSDLRKIAGKSFQLDVARLGLPVVFQARLRQEFEATHPATLSRALQFTLTEGLDSSTTEFVAKTALPQCEKFGSLQSFEVVKCAAENQGTLNGSIRNALDICLNNLIRFKSDLSESQIEVILACCQTHKIGSSAVCEALGSVSVSWTPEMKAALLNSFRLDQCPLPLAEFVLDLTPEKRDQLIKSIDVLKLVEEIALANLHQENDPDRQRQLSLAVLLLAGAQTRISEKLAATPHQLAETLFYLGSVGLFPEEPLQQLFDEQFQRSLCHNPRGGACVVELEKWLNMKFGASNPYKAIPELSAIHGMVQSSSRRSLSQTLQVGLGGKEFFSTRMETPLGTLADYVVAMRGGEYAMSFSGGSSNPLEKLPPGSKVVAILLKNKQSNDSDWESFQKVQLSLRERNLRAQNFCTLVIDVEEFESMRPALQTPFLMKQIKGVLTDGPVYSGEAPSS